VKKLVFLIALLAVGGCGRSGREIPDTVDVSGTVTLDGKPVEGVEVNFMTDESAAFGKTDREGKFELVQGAAPGQNKVFFSKIEGGDIVLDPESGMDEGQLQAMAQAQGGQSGVKVARQIIPQEYSNPDSPLTFNVPDGGTDKANFKLSSK
jgi:hypothetical protein